MVQENADRGTVLEGTKTSRGQLAQIEGVVFLTVVILIVQAIFGESRRRSHSLVLKYLLWPAYLLSATLISYSMGHMHAASFQNEFFAVWAVFLLIVLGSTDSLTAFKLEETEQKLKYIMDVFIQSFWMGWLLYLYNNKTSFSLPIWMLYIVIIAKVEERSQTYMLASRSSLQRNAKFITDFMSYEHQWGNPGGLFNSVDMTGYNYLVLGEHKANWIAKPPFYQKRLRETEKLMTTHKIWQCKGRLLARSDPDNQLKDICLSFALFKLLSRRFANYPSNECCHEAREKTRNFVKDGLFSQENDYERAFRVIEVELSFLYDLFYTKYPVIFRPGRVRVRMITFVIVVIGCLAALPILSSYQTPEQYVNLAINGFNIDVLITFIVIVATLIVELLQFFFLVFSDWAKVRLICEYVERSSWHESESIEKMIELVCRRRLLKPWGRKLGQYCFLESFDDTPWWSFLKYFFSTCIEMPRKGQKESCRILLPAEIKKAIVLSLKNSACTLSNGEASLQGNGVVDKLSWACKLEGSTQVIMVWHIATSLCEFDSSKSPSSSTEDGNQQAQRENFIVATSLSKYCAYLVAFAPGLLPDHAYDTEFIFDRVVIETSNFLGKCKTKEERYEKMMELGDEHHGQSTIERGAVIGKYLIGHELRWKILSEFWTQLILFLAPSDNLAAHAEYLASGGEFITHLWALLSHAGILQRDSPVPGF